MSHGEREKTNKLPQDIQNLFDVIHADDIGDREVVLYQRLKILKFQGYNWFM